MSQPVHPVRILVLEDDAIWQTLITGITDNEGVICEIVPSIKEFKEKFEKCKYRAVVLDNRVKDGSALVQTDLPGWIRREDPDVRIAFNSSSNFSQLAETVGACELCKEPMKLRNFLREIR